MISLLDRIKQPRVIIADGAIGTLLIERGLKKGEPPEKVNLENPEILEEIAGEYFEAGAEIIQTNTFGASPLKLASFGLADKTEEINKNAVRSVKKAVGNRAYVSGSCGPSGKLLQPYGDVSEDEMIDSFQKQLKILINEGVDNICIETMTDLKEAVLAVQAAKSISQSVPVCATMTFDSTPRGFFTIMGVSIEQAVKGLTEAGADVIGTNCGNGIEKMTLIAREMRKFTSIPLIVQSNAGIPALKHDRLIYPESPEYMSKWIPQLIDTGVKIIGGCCGTTPAHITLFRKIIYEYYN